MNVFYVCVFSVLLNSSSGINLPINNQLQWHNKLLSPFANVFFPSQFQVYLFIYFFLLNCDQPPRVFDMAAATAVLAAATNNEQSAQTFSFSSVYNCAGKKVKSSINFFRPVLHGGTWFWSAGKSLFIYYEYNRRATLPLDIWKGAKEVKRKNQLSKQQKRSKKLCSVFQSAESFLLGDIFRHSSKNTKIKKLKKILMFKRVKTNL